MQYEKLCKDILDAIGGKENISEVFHCVTRLRIIAKDKSKVDFEKLKNTKDILQVKEIGNQIQLVIGLQVPDVYDDFCEMTGLDKKAEVAADEDEKDVPAAKHKKENPITSLLNTLAAIVTPTLWAIIAGGMLKGIISTLEAFGWMAAKGDAAVILGIIADAPFYFMPFLVGFASAKRFKVNEAFGVMMAGILMYPTILNGAADSTVLHFLGMAVPCINYKNSIFPVILSVWVFSIIFHFIDKHMNKNIRIVFSGLLAFMIAGPIALIITAPLGNYIATVLVSFFSWLFAVSGPIAGAVFCGIIPLTIIFGIKGFSVIELANIEQLGYDYMLPMFFYSNLAVSGATIAASLKLKAGNKKSAAISTGLLGILGVTEPALYGTDVPMKTPLWSCMAGGAIAGCVAMLLGVHTYAFSMPGITSIATYFDSTGNIFKLLIVMAVAWLASFAISYVLTKKQPEGEE
ncbi:MAG: PTS transporter subunit EIIC [Solobacterium sp.]|jgi:PTS system beta-glucosides-specific IIC component|nr:PTS transporter subunit EIIC [Solobacterium sp.]MCH4206013.1 PTS transporter subunit EIIC [Solobacterium sp.]MCH4227379.1 PTS transporter subunit EIIC [Solobacterium sp.]MCH4282748.1 PTS transporter subunit EIIC [Solobacterium sp.]